MGNALKRRPSAALVVASIALFASLGGAAVANLNIRDNTINTRDIKDNQVNTKDLRDDAANTRDIRNNQVNTLDIRDGAVYGKDVTESTLDQVPSAADADALAGVRAVRIDSLTLPNGAARQVLEEGPFIFTTACLINEGGNDFARINIATTAENSAVDANTSDADFDPGDSPLQFVQVATATGNPAIDQESAAIAIAPDGTEVHGGNAYAAVNTTGQAGVCRFGGLLLVG